MAEEKLLALDAQIVKESARNRDKNGYLHVKTSNLTQDQVAPYYGKEIPGWKERNLDPDRIYYGWRHPDELKKAVDSFNGVPLLIEHRFDSAEAPNTDLRIGTVGTSAKWEPPYITNVLSVWTEKAIDAIEDGRLRDLSCGYRYEPDFTPGETPDGLSYDFVMRNIVCNHVALVNDGRAPDCYVADEKPKGISMTEEKKVNGACDDFTEFARKAIDESGVELTPEQKDALVRSFAESHASFEKQEAEAANREIEGTRDENSKEGAGDNDQGKSEGAADEGDGASTEEEKKDNGGAMDAALIADQVRKSLASQYKAAEDVRSVLGNVDALAYDSADAIYLDALKQMGVKGTPASSAKHVFSALQSVNASKSDQGAMDAAPKSNEGFLEKFIR